MTEPIYERVWDAFTHHQPHAHYHEPDVTAPPAPEAPIMSLATIVTAAENDAQALDGLVHGFLTKHLPQLHQLADSVENSELFKVALSLVGTLDPAVEAGAVTVLKALAGPVAAPAPAAVADPAMGQPEPAPAA